jgi:hypothetical protein
MVLICQGNERLVKSFSCFVDHDKDPLTISIAYLSTFHNNQSSFAYGIKSGCLYPSAERPSQKSAIVSKSEPFLYSLGKAESQTR